MTTSTMVQNVLPTSYIMKAANKMIVGDVDIFDSDLTGKKLTEAWEEEYKKTMDKKYAKGTRKFRRTKGKGPSTDYGDEPPIFLVPRVRGGPSYKSVNLKGVDKDDVMYCPISKGFPMQDVSSFTLGPVVGEGLCIVNAAFSKAVCTFHIEGGHVDLTRKTFWKKDKHPRYVIVRVDDNTMLVDGKKKTTVKWLKRHKDEWLPEWEKWRRHVAMASVGNFHWDGDTIPLAYKHGSDYLGFVEWKKECYIRPAYDLIPETDVYDYLTSLRNKGYPLGLVHPKACEGEEPITAEFVEMLYNSSYEMACMPYVVAGMLLGVEV